MKHMFGNRPRCWSESLDGWKRLRFMINVFTRMRYIKRSGKLDFLEMRTLGEQKKNLLPWFEFPERNEIRPTIIFGHWSSLGVYMQPGILAMDSGCCWGRCLSAVRMDREPICSHSDQVPKLLISLLAEPTSLSVPRLTVLRIIGLYNDALRAKISSKLLNQCELGCFLYFFMPAR